MHVTEQLHYNDKTRGILPLKAKLYFNDKSGGY